jgi:hypothetical protein
MRNRSFRYSLVVLVALALSTLTITCRSTGGLGPSAGTVELRQVQQFATVFNNVIDQAIANRSGSVAEFVDICPDLPISKIHRSIWTTRVNIVRTTRSTRTTGDMDPPIDLSVGQLQEIRALVNLRVDEAFQAGGDTSRYKDLLGLQFDRNGISGTVNAPRASVQISGAQ